MKLLSRLALLLLPPAMLWDCFVTVAYLATLDEEVIVSFVARMPSRAVGIYLILNMVAIPLVFLCAAFDLQTRFR